MPGTSPSLRNAIRTAIADGCLLDKIDQAHWCTTFRASRHQLRATWEAELTKSFNSSDGVEGK